MRLWTALVLVLVTTAPAAAQSTYVSGSVIADLARFSKVETDDDDDLAGLVPEDSLDGEAIGFALAVGRRLGERWGVALEFAQGGTIEHDGTERISPLRTGIPSFFPIPGAIPIPFPEIELEVTASHQHTTVAALVWIHQEIGERIELAYLGGVSFNRSELERETRFVGLPSPLLPGVVFPIPVSSESELVEHGAGPAVGFDAIVKLGEHGAVVTGVRMLSVSAGGRGGWLIRPGAGFRWRF